MTVAETTGGLPYVLRETFTTTGRKVNLKINPQWICIRVSTNPCKLYFSQDDFDNDENYIGIGLPSVSNPYGEWKSNIDSNYIWIKGSIGSSDIELVCTSNPSDNIEDYLNMSGGGGFTGEDEVVIFEVSTTGVLTIGLRGINGTQLAVDPGDGSGLEFVNFLGIGTPTNYVHDYGGAPGNKTVTMYGVHNIYYFYGNSYPICNISAFHGMLNCRIFEIGNYSGVTGSAFGVFTAEKWPALSGATAILNLKLNNIACTPADFSELTGINDLILNNMPMTGDIGDFNTLTSVDLLYAYNNGSLTYTTHSWPELSNFEIRWNSNGLDSTEVDNILIDFAASNSHDGDLYLAGTNAARTSASDAAMAVLLINNVIVDVNE